LIGSILRIRYEITEELADGPIFTTYVANDRVQGREVTIRVFKQPFSSEPEFIEAVRRVVAKYSGVYSNGIEAMIEVDDHEGQPFLISEYSKGTSLEERILKLAPFSVSVAVSTAISICEGLSGLHQRNVAHGDVSAANIVMLPDGQCRLQLAGLWETFSASRTAGSVALPAMAAYLSPEISAGGMPSAQGDVYAVGILLYQLLSGRLPYSADTAVAMALKHATSGVPSVKIFNNAVPAALDEIVKRSMAKEPEVRYKDASELLSDLRILQDGLRFGRTLNWPLKQPQVEEKQPVAPKMSAIREPEKTEKKKKEKEPRDVPVWLLVMIAFFGAIVLALVGVYVVFNVSQPKLVTVPNVKGSKISEARKTLEGMKLKLRVSGQEENEQYPPDTVLELNPPPGRKLHEGATVSVRISSGSRLVEVPDLKGATVDKAKAMLEGLNLHLDGQVDQAPDPAADAGTIISQSPAAREKIARYSPVKVTISSGRSGGEAPRNDENEKQYLYNLTIKLSGINSAVTLKVDIQDSHGTRTIYEQMHDAEETVQVPAQGYGKEATFRIYYDDQLVKEIKKKAEGEAPADAAPPSGTGAPAATTGENP